MDGLLRDIVLSASRRTDIPAHYLDSFLASLAAGFFEIENPVTHIPRRIEVPRERLHSVVFWSKDYGRLLERADEVRGVNPYFHFTINSEDPLLEPCIPPLASRLDQLRRLASQFGAERICWRFDPIVHYCVDGRPRDNLSQFGEIARAAAACGVRRMTLSFADHYRKIDRRLRRFPGAEIRYPAGGESEEVLRPLAAVCASLGIEVLLCCEKDLVHREVPGTRQGRCIDVELLCRLYGPGPAVRPDTGQRREAGCGCHVSVDVGSYAQQPCRSGCLYCYAIR